jgi:hypothetical protein
MNIEALKEAIMRRRGKGLDLNIFLGGPEGMMGEQEDESEKLQDLAPEVKDGGIAEDEMMEEGDEMAMAEGPEHADAPQDKALIAKMLDEYGKSPMREKMKAMKKG